MLNAVVDLSHHNRIDSFDTVRNADIIAVIHKASQGATYTDPTFAINATRIRDAAGIFVKYTRPAGHQHRELSRVEVHFTIGVHGRSAARDPLGVSAMPIDDTVVDAGLDFVRNHAVAELGPPTRSV